MYKITFSINGIEGKEGIYKDLIIAKRHLRRLQKRYIETKFKLKEVKRTNVHPKTL